tara:strand:+ start:931 stop:1179 length:249 start_codon:yes stop_codon:yes gene_type:complete
MKTLKTEDTKFTNLNKDNRKSLINQLLELQQKESKTWAIVHGREYKNHKNYSQILDKMYFEIDLLNIQIDKIKEVLINNKFN